MRLIRNLITVRKLAFEKKSLYFNGGTVDAVRFSETKQNILPILNKMEKK